MKESIILIGATGLIGQELLKLLLNDTKYNSIKVLVRRDIGITHPKLECVLVDFNNDDDLRRKLGRPTVIFCCVGTTQQKVKGDKIAYKKVDFEIPYHAALFGKDARAQKFLLVSSVGANETSRNFYLQLKGKTENFVRGVGIPSVHFFRPSILLGERKESRPGEYIGKTFMQLFSFAFLGTWNKYKPIHVKTVAAAMVNASHSGQTGVHVYEYEQIKKSALSNP